MTCSYECSLCRIKVTCAVYRRLWQRWAGGQMQQLPRWSFFTPRFTSSPRLVYYQVDLTYNLDPFPRKKSPTWLRPWRIGFGYPCNRACIRPILFSGIKSRKSWNLRQMCCLSATQNWAVAMVANAVDPCLEEKKHASSFNELHSLTAVQLCPVLLQQVWSNRICALVMGRKHCCAGICPHHFEAQQVQGFLCAALLMQECPY